MRLDIIPLGILFTFDVAHKSSAERVTFYKQLYGHTTTSHSKKYKYKRPGLLTNLKHLRPTHSTIIITMNDAPALRKFFKQNKVKFSENAVMLHEQEARKLNVVSPSTWVNVYRELLGKEDTIMGLDW